MIFHGTFRISEDISVEYGTGVLHEKPLIKLDSRTRMKWSSYFTYGL